LPGDSIRVTPDACTDLIFPAGGLLLFNGPMTVAEVVTLHTELTTGVRFRPGTRVLVAGVLRLREMRDSDLVVGDGRGWASASGDHLLGFVRELQGRHATERNAVVDAVLAAIDASVGTGCVLGDIYGALGVRERQVERLFDLFVGLTPRQTLRVLRQSLVTRSLRVGSDGLAELAADLGYSDQPHLTREYRALAGLTPGRYRREIDGVGFVQDSGRAGPHAGPRYKQ